MRRVIGHFRRQMRFVILGVREQTRHREELERLREQVVRLEEILEIHSSRHGRALESHAIRIDELTRSIEAILAHSERQAEAYRDALIDVAARLGAIESRVDH